MITLTEGQILKQSEPLRFTERGIYFLIKGDRVVYVGQSRHNMLVRIADHTHSKDFDSVAVHAVAERWSSDDLDELEAEYIWELEPPYNGNLPPSSRYMAKPALKGALGVTGHRLNQILRKSRATPRLGKYYDIEELKPFL